MNTADRLTHILKIFEDKQSIIRLMDSKASAMLVACGILLSAGTFIISLDSANTMIQYAGICFVLLIVSTMVINILGVLWPRTIIKSDSKLFFPEICEDDSINYENWISTSEDDILKSYAIHITSLCKIIDIKGKYFKCSSAIFAVSTINLIVVVLTYI